MPCPDDSELDPKKKYFDELCEDERLAHGELHYKVSSFYTNMDIFISQLSARFEGLLKVMQHFRCIHPTALTSEKDAVLFDAVFELAKVCFIIKLSV